MVGVICRQQIDKLLLGAVPREPHSPVLAPSGIDQVPGKLKWRLKFQKGRGGASPNIEQSVIL